MFVGWFVIKIGEKWFLVIVMFIDVVVFVFMGLVYYFGLLVVVVFVNGMVGVVYGIV